MIKTTILCDVCKKEITTEPMARGFQIRSNDPKGSLIMDLQLCEKHSDYIMKYVTAAIKKINETKKKD